MALVGARVTIEGANLPGGDHGMPVVLVGDVPARVVLASSHAIRFHVPEGLTGGRHRVRVDGASGDVWLDVGSPFATGLHQVDNPVFDRERALYVTYSGARGQQVPVSVFRVRPDGGREPFVTGMVNATSMAFDAAGALHVSSRFDGAVYRVRPDGQYDTVATELGVACGLAFAADGTMFVGDRSGTVFRVTVAGRVAPFATLPPSIAAFHLVRGPGEHLYVTGPTFGTYDAVYRIDRRGEVTVVSTEFGRPQGMAVDEQGRLHVVDALAGSAGLFLVQEGRPREMVLAAPALVGVAFDPSGGVVVASNETAFRIDAPTRPWRGDS